MRKTAGRPAGRAGGQGRRLRTTHAGGMLAQVHRGSGRRAPHASRDFSLLPKLLSWMCPDSSSAVRRTRKSIRRLRGGVGPRPREGSEGLSEPAGTQTAGLAQTGGRERRWRLVPWDPGEAEPSALARVARLSPPSPAGKQQRLGSRP